MSGVAFLRIKKLKGSNIVNLAARHNRRDIQAESGASKSIDSTRSGLNETLHGPPTAADVGHLAREMMTEAGVTRLRKDAVMAIEIVFSLPPGHLVEDRAYFVDCVSWVGTYFGGVILSADVHRDEAAPHCHVLILPLVNNRMDGGRMVGGRQKFAAMHQEFHEIVATRHGLRKPPAKLSGPTKRAAAQAVINKLRETADAALVSAAWPTIKDAIENDPSSFLLALGIELKGAPKKLRTVAEIFTSKGKGKAKDPMSIDFAPIEKRQSLCSVDFTQKRPSAESAAVIELSTATAGACDEPAGAVGNSGRNGSMKPAEGEVRNSHIGAVPGHLLAGDIPLDERPFLCGRQVPTIERSPEMTSRFVASAHRVTTVSPANEGICT